MKPFEVWRRRHLDILVATQAAEDPHDTLPALWDAQLLTLAGASTVVDRSIQPP